MMRIRLNTAPLTRGNEGASARPIARMLAEGAGVAAAAAFLRSIGLYRYGFNSDEAVYAGQAAAIAGFHPYGQLFGVFRAHPLLVHFLLALGYQLTGVNDWLPRLVAAAFGVALALLCWGTTRLLVGSLGGLGAGLLVAASPYAITISRQVLLDGPMATLVALTMFLVACWLTTGRRSWLYAAAAAAGLAFLAKETAILLLPAVVVLFVLTPNLPLRWRVDVPLVSLVYLATVAPYPLSLALAGGGGATEHFLGWQLTRRPNHDTTFYLGMLPTFGYAMLVLALFGLVAHWRRWHPMATFALVILGGNLVFFQAWPTKGFAYLMPVMPPLAYFAGHGIAAIGRLAELPAPRWPRPRVAWRRPAVATLATALAVASLILGGGNAVAAPVQVATDSDTSDAPPVGIGTGALAGTGGLEAARPSGQWARTHTLPTAQFMTVGPSFANVIQFYGQRKALGLSVSSNPLRRNPTYEPIRNPDASIRSGATQYLVYDAYSAARSPFFARKLMGYVRKFSGTVVYEYRRPPGSPTGSGGSGRLVVIYEVHP